MTATKSQLRPIARAFASTVSEETSGCLRAEPCASGVRDCTARTEADPSKVRGAVIWALRSHCTRKQIDHGLGKLMNHNLVEYHVPVNADIHDIQVEFVHEDGWVVSRLGVKGVGKTGNVGVSAAICNATFMPPAAASPSCR